MDSDLIVGQLVRHANKPAWGLGKIIELTHDRVWVYFKDVEGTPKDAVKQLSVAQSHLQLAETQSDAHLDNLPSMVKSGKLSIPAAFRVTEQQAIDLFVKKLRSFEDAEYLEKERNYKWNAHQAIVSNLSVLEHGSPEEAATVLKRWVGLTNLLATQETMALNDGFKDAPLALAYGRAYLEFARQGSQHAFDELVRATESLPALPGKARVLTWPTVTLLPFLIAPDRAMFLKPQQTRRMAAACFVDCSMTRGRTGTPTHV